jgi:hypothetical protein
LFMYRRLSIGVVVIAVAMPALGASCGPAACPGSCSVSPFAEALSPFHRAIMFHAGTSEATAQSVVRQCRTGAVVRLGPFKVFGHGRSKVDFVGWSNAVTQTNRGREKEDGQIIAFQKCLSKSPSVIGLGGLGA